MTEYTIDDDLYAKALDEVFTNVRQEAPASISDEQVCADAENHLDMTLQIVCNNHETWLSQKSFASEMSSTVANLLLQRHRKGLITLLTMGKEESQSTAEQIVDNHIVVHK